jgi:ribosomal protein L37AE/L43A
MGIRFACNLCQHSLNIKRELAGKIGVCPKCGGRIRIPSIDASHSAPAHSNGSKTIEQAGNSLESAEPSTPTETTGQSLESPLDEVGAQWFVRPPAGGQYGPASGETIRTWIAENRVTGSTLIWRDGWPHWRAARDSLPELAESNTQTLASNHTSFAGNLLDDPLNTQSTKSLPSNHSPSNEKSPSNETRVGQQRDNRSQRRIALIVALALLSIFLIVTLVFLAIRS